MFSLEDYLMDRGHSLEWTIEKKQYALILLGRVNNLLDHLGYKEDTLQISSGFRTQAINKQSGGSPKSGHCLGKAIDIKDSSGLLKKQINKDLLEQFDLYMEHPLHTPKWIHLDISKRINRIFIP